MDAVNCPLCPLFWLCKAMSPETDIDRANKQNAALRAENHALRERMIDAGLETGYVIKQNNRRDTK